MVVQEHDTLLDFLAGKLEAAAIPKPVLGQLGRLLTMHTLPHGQELCDSGQPQVSTCSSCLLSLFTGVVPEQTGKMAKK